MLCCYVDVLRLAPESILPGTSGGGRSMANNSVQLGRLMTEGNSSQSRVRNAVTSRRNARLQGPQIVSSSSIHCIACAMLWNGPVRGVNDWLILEARRENTRRHSLGARQFASTLRSPHVVRMKSRIMLMRC